MSSRRLALAVVVCALASLAVVAPVAAAEPMVCVKHTWHMPYVEIRETCSPCLDIDACPPGR